MISKTLFISDLHLSEKNTHLNILFEHFIENTLSAKNVDAVYILGDFFDMWIGDDAAGDWERSIASMLARLAKQNISLYFIVGNRDFLMQQSFVALAQGVLLSDSTVIELYGKRIVLKHGDDLCTADRSYQWFRWAVRSFFIKHTYLALPVVWRRALAARIREKSQHRGMRPIYAQVSSSEVKKLLQKNMADWLIHGHTHCPQMENISVDERMCQHIILCDWNKRGNQLVVSSNALAFLDYFD